MDVCQGLKDAFGFEIKTGNSSNFASSAVEVMKSMYLGQNGHIAVKTNSIARAAVELEKHGFQLDESTAKYKGEKMIAVYLKQEFGGFAVHLPVSYTHLHLWWQPRSPIYWPVLHGDNCF